MDDFHCLCVVCAVSVGGKSHALRGECDRHTINTYINDPFFSCRFRQRGYLGQLGQ